MSVFLSGIEFWWWWALALALLGLEVLTPGFFFLWFAIAATATGGIALAFDMSWQTQLLIFAVLGVAAMGLRFLWPRPKPAEESVNRPQDRFLGRQLKLETAIVNGVGSAKVGDSRWRVIGPDMPAGSEVKVIGLEGASLKVEAV